MAAEQLRKMGREECTILLEPFASNAAAAAALAFPAHHDLTSLLIGHARVKLKSAPLIKWSSASIDLGINLKFGVVRQSIDNQANAALNS